MSSPFILDSLTLAGFRAYLVPATFEFGQRRSLAVFAPNGKGKSSIADGMEFILSGDGTLVRLGQRATDNQAGVSALAHNGAEKKGVTPTVAIRFKRGNERPEGSRPASGNQRPRPQVANEVSACLVVSPIIRGHDLRRFVEEETAQQRYESVARWLDLGALVDVQRDLRDLRRRLKADAEDESELRRLNSQLSRLTNTALAVWDDGAVLARANGMLAALDKDLAFAVFSPEDSAYATLRSRAESEARRLGLEGLRQLRRAIVAIVDPEDETAGSAAAFGAAIQANADATTREQAERSAAADAVFAEIWKAAEPLFAEGAEAPETCPVCQTPIDKSGAGSLDAVRQHLAGHRAALAAYADAKRGLDAVRSQQSTAQQRLVSSLKSLAPLIPDSIPALKSALNGYLADVEAWSGGDAPNPAAFADSAHDALVQIDADVDAIMAAQGENTYVKALAHVDALTALAVDRQTALRVRQELGRILDEVNQQAQFVSAEIRKKVQGVLDTLQGPINAIYREIQRDAAVPIRLELPAEDDATQHRLNLVVDFAQNRIGVAPGGYFSDSQIHSLALALRLAAIRRCNTGAPFIVLDDIVTSYDADHRRAIAAMLGKEFAGFQLLVTTHDERFFLYLKELLGEAEWRFTRITHIDPEYGPRFSDQLVSDDEIAALWAKGQSAANEMRTAEEEWLLGVCRDFGVDVRIRTVERAHSYERSELAAALASFLKSRGLTPPAVPGVANRFLTTLQQGVVENFGSHFQDAQYGAGSPGDEKVRWEEFRTFRKQFVCGCGKARFKRPHGINVPVCQKCETTFAFPPAAKVV